MRLLHLYRASPLSGYSRYGWRISWPFLSAWGCMGYLLLLLRTKPYVPPSSGGDGGSVSRRTIGWQCWKRGSGQRWTHQNEAILSYHRAARTRRQGRVSTAIRGVPMANILVRRNPGSFQTFTERYSRGSNTG